MKYLQSSFTVPAAPQKITACERCVYGRGHHATWCEHGPSVQWWIFGTDSSTQATLIKC